MKRVFNWLAPVALGLLCLGCGGGGTPTNVPDPGTGNPGGNDTGTQRYYDLIGPESVQGSHSLSAVPGQVNVLTTAKGAELTALAAKHGYTVLHQRDSIVTFVLPNGVSSADAKLALEKEFNVTKVEPVNRIVTPRIRYSGDLQRSASFTPGDPFYGEQFVGLGDDGTNLQFQLMMGQAQPMNIMGFNAAWDVSLNASVAVEPVKIAIIDAGWLDYSTPGTRPGFDETLIDPLSAAVDGAGTATTGLAAIVWDVPDDADPATRDFPIRDRGEYMLGILAATLNDFLPWALLDTDNPPDGVQADEAWNEGMAGINPNASYLLIKTGTESGGNWTFSDNEIAESIDYAVANGANIILLGMFAEGTVAANVSAAIQAARDANVLVVCAAGDVTDTFDGGSQTFTGTAVDITTTTFTPSSDPNIVSVTGVGVNRVDLADLPGIDVDGDMNPDGPNPGLGWTPRFGDPVSEDFRAVAAYNNTGATIAAVGYAIGFGAHPYITSGAGTLVDPVVNFPAEEYRTVIQNFGTLGAAAYVAGAASMVYQTLSFVNGTPPTDDEVLAELLSTVQLPGMTGIVGSGPGTGGLLNAAMATSSAINGGGLVSILPAMAISSLQVSQPFTAVTRGTDFDVTVNVINGTAPFSIEIDWDNGGNPPNITTVDPWTNGDPVTLTGGYETLGIKIVNITVTDADGRVATASFQCFVLNPLTANITIENASGVAQLPAALQDSTPYRFRANAANIYTGDVNGAPNTTTFTWDFGDGTPTVEGPSPSHTYAATATGPHTVTLTVTEDARPDQTFTLDVTVL